MVVAPKAIYKWKKNKKQSPGDNSSVLSDQGLHGFLVSVVRIGPLAHLDMCFLLHFFIIDNGYLGSLVVMLQRGTGTGQ